MHYAECCHGARTGRPEQIQVAADRCQVIIVGVRQYFVNGGRIASGESQPGGQLCSA